MPTITRGNINIPTAAMAARVAAAILAIPPPGAGDCWLSGWIGPAQLNRAQPWDIQWQRRSGSVRVRVGLVAYRVWTSMTCSAASGSE